MKTPGMAGCIAALLILLLLILRRAASDDAAPVLTMGQLTGSSNGAEDDGGREKPFRKQARPWTRARISSLLNLQEGELGMIKIPPDAMERHFRLDEEDLSSRPGVSRVFSPEQAAEALESASRDGSLLTAKLGVTTDRLRWGGGGLDIEIEGGENTAAFVVDLQLSLTDAIGRSRTSITVYAGHSLLIRPRDASSSGYLLVTGKARESR